MNKEQATEVKKYVDTITDKTYKKTFSKKSATLHIRIGTYTDGSKDKEWINSKIEERKEIIWKIGTQFPGYEVAENNKRYQGFINDICITVR